MPICAHFSHFERLLDLLLTLFYKRFTLILLYIFAEGVEDQVAIATFPELFGVASVAVPHLRRIFTFC